MAALQPVADIVDLSLEQLTRVTVTTASLREERAVEAPASIFVITAEDIRRSGATTLPEALRLAPNLQVVRTDTSQYIVSARGGLAGTANKMLVLIDGRTVYTPLFAGVFYDAQNIFIEDIERIEVISGPGSTLWGTNGVNGVINVISKSAAKTRGALLAAGGGDKERGVGARYGGPLASGGDYRLYARYFDRLQNRLASGASARDQGDRWQVGFRADDAAPSRGLTLHGDLYAANIDNFGGARDLSGGNLLVRWRAATGPDSEWYLQSYYDRTEREHRGTFKEKRDTLDLEMHHALKLKTDHRLVWGAGHRASRDRTEPTQAFAFTPASRTLLVSSLFVQDEWQATRAFSIIAGVRAERNSYTGVEWLPNLRTSLQISPDQMAWAALSRAVRSPSRIDRDLMVPGFPPFAIVANDTFQSEVANVAEVGYRAALTPGISLSLTAFHHEFRKLRTLEPGNGSSVLANGASGRTHGIEGWGDWTVTRDWRLVWGFVAMRDRLRLEPGRVNLTADPLGNNPRRTASLRSHWNVTPAHEVDLAVRYTGGLANPVVPPYTVIDARLGWHVTREIELSLVVANAFDREHIEFTPTAQAALLGRSVFLKATWAP